MKLLYTDIVNSGKILPKKAKYTKRDVDNVLITALFIGDSCTKELAVFIVKCSAVFHKTDWSSGVSSYLGKAAK